MFYFTYIRTVLREDHFWDKHHHIWVDHHSSTVYNTTIYRIPEKLELKVKSQNIPPFKSNNYLP